MGDLDESDEVEARIINYRYWMIDIDRYDILIYCNIVNIASKALRFRIKSRSFLMTLSSMLGVGWTCCCQDSQGHAEMISSALAFKFE